MAATLGEWRRERSTCKGALLWTLNDVLPGAGWGVLDHRGKPKAAYWYLRRALAPVAVWMTDEGLNGVSVHLANDTALVRSLTLDVRVVPFAGAIGPHATRTVELPPRTVSELSVESELGAFADVGQAFHFGIRRPMVITASLSDAGVVLSRAALFPAGRPLEPQPGEHLGLRAEAEVTDGAMTLSESTERFAYGVRIEAPGFDCSDDWLTVVPGDPHVVPLRPRSSGAAWSGARLRAINLQGSTAVPEQLGYGRG